LKILVLLFCTCLLLSGCQPIENSARDAIAAADGFISQAQRNHLDECKANPSKSFPCVKLNQAVGAQNLLIDVTEQYCGWPNRPGAAELKALAGQKCIQNKTILPYLKNAVASLNSVLADYKVASGGQP